MTQTLPKTPLREYRKARKLTLANVASELGMSGSQLSRVEREGTDSLPLALRLAEITNEPPEAFVKSKGA